MKKIIAIVLFACFMFSETTYGQFKMNASAGLNISTNELNVDYIDSKSRLAYFIGFAPEFQVHEKIKFALDVQYSVKGYKTDSNTFNSPTEHRFTYLDFIPEIEYEVLEFLSIGVGFNYGFKLSEELKIGDQDWSNAFQIIKSSDFGLTGKLKLHYNNIFVFTRYNLGMINISDATFADDNGNLIETSKQLNRNLQIGAGYTF